MFASIVHSFLLLVFVALSGAVHAQSSITLQNGLNGYTGSDEAQLWGGSPTVNRDDQFSIRTEGTSGTCSFCDSEVIRFAIFASEGGPVPDGATIISATLSMYKFGGPDGVIRAVRLLKSWNASTVTWASPWTTGGANGVGTDMAATADGEGSVADAAANDCGNPPEKAVCWLHIDVTSGVQSFSANPADNFGWKIAQVSSSVPGNYKNFVTTENLNYPASRPKLAITYTTTAPTTVTIQQGLNGYTGSDEAQLWGGSPTVNRDDQFSIRTEGTSGTCSFCDSEVIRFAIFQSEGGPVPNDATVTSATLSMYKFGGPDAVIKASRLLKSWSASTVTWASPWTTGGANGIGTDVLGTADGQGSVADATPNDCGNPPEKAVCWLHIDVTSGVQAFKADPAGTNFGWKIAQVSSSIPGNYKNFVTTENLNYPASRPRLTVTYVPGGGGGGDPTAPTARYTWSQVPGTLDVTFNASGSLDNGATITALKLRFGHGNPEVEANWTDKNVPQTHTFPAPGQYTVKLTATNSVGTSPEYSQQIEVTDPNSGDIVPTTPAAGAIGKAVPTFHSMSLYYNPNNPTPAPTNETIWMRYRRASESAWREGWRLWFDPRTTGTGLPYTDNGQQFRARGSAVYLQPNTKYYFEFGTGSSFATATWHHHVSGTTWSETFAQDGATIAIPNAGGSCPAAGPCVITQGGSATTGYKVYDGWNGSGRNVIDRGGANPGGYGFDNIDAGSIGNWPDGNFVIVIKASYVVVRNIVARGAYAAGIVIHPNVTNVVIEDSEIYDWSWRKGTVDTSPSPIGTPPSNPYQGWTWGMNEGGGIHLVGNNSRIIIQRNVIRDPHLGSTPWLEPISNPSWNGHAIGPIGISVQNAAGQNVFRYNEIYASGPHVNQADKAHWMLDAISGGDNFGEKGVPGADSDIYHNIVRNVMDDGIEAEGGGRNVRVWGNYIDHTSKSGIGTTTVHFGPMYVFRNVINRVRGSHDTAQPEDEGWDRGIGFKAYGMVGGFGGGREYFFNNTHLQQPGDTYSPPQPSDLGASAGIYGASSGQGLKQVCSRNNIYHHFRTWGTSIVLGDQATNNDLNYDLFSRPVQPDGATPDDICTDPPAPGTFEAHGIQAAPIYKSGHGWDAFPRLTAEPSGSASSAQFRAGLGVGIGQFQLDSTSSGLNAGKALPNFTYDIDNTALAAKSGVAVGGTPDMGAHDSASTASMKFGLSGGQ